MSQDIHSALDECKGQAERLVEEIRKFLLRRPSLNGNAAQASAR